MLQGLSDTAGVFGCSVWIASIVSVKRREFRRGAECSRAARWSGQVDGLGGEDHEGLCEVQGQLSSLAPSSCIGQARARKCKTGFTQHV
jgi:hypothetical protein